MKEIQLTQGKVAIVDDEFYDELSKYKWHVERIVGHICASRTMEISKINNKRKKTTIKMHRMVYELAYGVKLTKIQHIDHIDRNALNNTIDNIRLVTRSQNMRNSVRKRSVTGYIGVYLEKRTKSDKCYKCQIAINGKIKHLGMFSNPVKAAYAYDNKYREIEGNELQCNFKSPLGWCFIEV